MDIKRMKAASLEEYEAVLKNAPDLLVTAEYEMKDGKKYHVSDVFHSENLGLYYRKDVMQDKKTAGGKHNGGE